MFEYKYTLELLPYPIYMVLVLCLLMGSLVDFVSSMEYILIAGATQVKWNRYNPMTLASAHNGEVRIWDIRVRNN